MLIGGVALSTPTVSRALSAKLLVLLGEASFSLYILQHPVYRIFNVFVATPLGLAPAPRFLAYFALLIALSVVSFLCLERPVNRFMRKLFLNSFRTPHAALVAT
jgi:peptidoglycan/LPS O-acetylase OafA/YrhL